MCISVRAIMVGLLLGTGTSVRAAELRVGVAAVEITPPIGYRMSGYFMERISTAVHDPLQAKAIVLQQGDTAAALIVCDLIGMPKDVSAPARQAISKATGIPVAHIAITATHTHTGPLFYGTMRQALHDAAMAREGRDPCEPIDYPGLLTARIVAAATKAHAAMQPMHLTAAVVPQEPVLSFNRRYRMKDGSVQSNTAEKPKRDQIVEPMGPIDPDVSVLLVRGRDDKPIAGLTVFAMHQDTTGGTEFSADYAYHLGSALREAFDPSFVSVFGIGTCGNINHCDVKAAQWRTAADIGPLLARSVRAAADRARPLDPIDLAVRSTTLDVPLQHYEPQRVRQAALDVPKIGKGQLPFLKEVEAYKIVDLQSRPGATASLEVQAIRLSRDTAIVAMPGEMFVEFGLAIKQASPFKNTFILELANDNVSYVPTKQAFAEGSYETVNSRLAPGGGEMLTDAAIALLKALAE